MTRCSLTFDPARGYPVGKRVTYTCLACSNDVPSKPSHAEACRCGNIAIDPDAGRISVQHADQIVAYESDSTS